MKPIRVLTIAGSDSGGGAGIQADLKTITVCGGFGMSVITALTAQNTLGVQGIHEVPPAFVAAQFDSVLSDIGADAAKTGMLASREVLEVVAAKIRQYGIEKLVVDPVMVAKGGASLIRGEVREVLIRELLPLACVVTPNIPEAEVLAQMKIAGVDDMKRAAEAIFRRGPRSVLIKGGHLAGNRRAVDILLDGGGFREFAAEWFDTADTHGTGCTYAAAIATGLAKGKPLAEAVDGAKRYITEAIRHSLRIGGGHGPTNHFAPVGLLLERQRCLEKLRAAVQRLLEEPVGAVIPEVSSNLGYAVPGARGIPDVAAVPGRIVRLGEGAGVLCEPAFGASTHIARVILAAMRHDPGYRSAMNIRFSEDTLEACRRLGLQLASFDRADEPEEIKNAEGSTLEWGTDAAIARRGSVPDCVWDRGGIGKEPMIRVLGKSPGEVADRVIGIARMVRKRCGGR
ncbi:MAG TPA: bifunctional hydroxymethylpyrimidine kinase/phosphomethylpyrimidine kinase [Syntrophales bacterium]|nr:bifunctional hydroxymethylpyrimidine kinase/phosphomethylpyrimidine kinase [Syntrophales bacterium]